MTDQTPTPATTGNVSLEAAEALLRGRDTSAVAALIRKSRAERNMTQRQVAQATGIDQSDLSRYENGRQAPNAATLQKIMDALGGSDGLTSIAEFKALWGEKREGGKLRRVNTLDEAPPIEWLIHGLVARGAVTMVAGAPGAGKSLLTQSLGVTMAEALAAFNAMKGKATAEEAAATVRRAGFDVSPGRVVVIDAENGEHIIQRRARSMGLSEDGAENYVVMEADGFDLEADASALRAVLEQEEADFLIVDSWMSLWGGSENSADAVKRCLNGLRELARDLNVGILLIHHTQKSGDGYRGSGAIAATIEAVFSFVRDDEGRPEDRLIFCEKMRLDAEPKTRRVQVTTTGVYDEADMI